MAVTAYAAPDSAVAVTLPTPLPRVHRPRGDPATLASIGHTHRLTAASLAGSRRRAHVAAETLTSAWTSGPGRDNGVAELHGHKHALGRHALSNALAAVAAHEYARMQTQLWSRADQLQGFATAFNRDLETLSTKVTATGTPTPELSAQVSAMHDRRREIADAVQRVHTDAQAAADRAARVFHAATAGSAATAPSARAPEAAEADPPGLVPGRLVDRTRANAAT